MKDNRKIMKREILETVRERERELYSSEISFIYRAENICKLNMKKADKKDGLYAIKGM